jgi:3-hydroxyisobutyrate dehydrogenase-like beta-hydroxyacid dehydrogenase
VVNFIVQSGAKAASSIKHAAGGVDFVITMLPVGALAQQAAVSAYARPACQSV